MKSEIEEERTKWKRMKTLKSKLLSPIKLLERGKRLQIGHEVKNTLVVNPMLWLFMIGLIVPLFTTTG